MAKQETSTTVPSPGPRNLSEQERAEIERRFWAAVDRIQERNADKDPDEEYVFITSVVEEVRQERYEREQRKAQGRG